MGRREVVAASAAAVVLVGLAAALRSGSGGAGELLAAAPSAQKEAARKRLGAKALAFADHSKTARELHDIEHDLKLSIKRLAPKAKQMALSAENGEEPAAEAPAPAAAPAEASEAAAAPAPASAAPAPAEESGEGSEDDARADAAEEAENTPEASAFAAGADVVGCAGEPGGCVGTHRAEREFIPLLIFAIIGAVMFWSYHRFQQYDAPPEKPIPAPPRTVLFAPSRRVYDTFGAEVPGPAKHGLQSSYVAQAPPRQHYAPQYSVPSNV